MYPVQKVAAKLFGAFSTFTAVILYQLKEFSVTHSRDL